METKNDDFYSDVYSFLNAKGIFTDVDCDLFCLQALIWCWKNKIDVHNVPFPDMKDTAFYTCGFPISVLNAVWENNK